MAMLYPVTTFHSTPPHPPAHPSLSVPSGMGIDTLLRAEYSVVTHSQHFEDQL